MDLPEKHHKVNVYEVKELLLTMQASYLSKLKGIEDKIEAISSKYVSLEKKVEHILLGNKGNPFKISKPNFTCPSEAIVPKFISENCEETYPNGSWLGNPNDLNTRVRCSISQQDLENINNTCQTAEKMALTLLDHLFDRETQARSNISGTGKHEKDKLDPMKIYGIKCHVMYKFKIHNKEWYRIKQNIDSKCRTAFSRKQKGLPLYAKRCKERSTKSHFNYALPKPNSLHRATTLESSLVHGTIIPKVECIYGQEPGFDAMLPFKLEQEGYSLTFTDAFGTQIIHTEHGDIEVIEATEEDLEQLKNSHHFEILSEGGMLGNNILETSP